MQYAIRIEHAEFSWKRGNWRLSIDDFRAKPGEHIFVKGPSGSGKSTFLSLVAGLITPHQGQIWLNDHALHSASARKRDTIRAQHIGFVFQQLNLVSYLSARDNVLLPCYFAAKKSHARCETLLTALGLPTSTWDRPAEALSVGQQQRVAIARALMTEPTLLIADEPTSALDTAHRDAFIETLLSESERLGTTVLFVSHDDALRTKFPVRYSIETESADHSRLIPDLSEVPCSSK